MREGRTLLDVEMRVIGREDLRRILASGRRATRAYLYEPEHAPPGTEFVQVDFGEPWGRVPYRIWRVE